MLRGQNAYAERAACPLYAAMAVIEGRWKPMVLQRLLERPRGFGELRRAIPRVTTKVLREQLRQMMADNLITRDELQSARSDRNLAPAEARSRLPGADEASNHTRVNCRQHCQCPIRNRHLCKNAGNLIFDRALGRLQRLSDLPVR